MTKHELAVYVRCKYCGAKLRSDWIGQFCPTKNCQWQHGISTAAARAERKK